MSKNPFRCQGVRADGMPCQSGYAQSNGWCWMHDPDRKAEVDARNVRLRERAKAERRAEIEDELRGPMEPSQERARRGKLYQRALELRMFERMELDPDDPDHLSRGEAAELLDCSESSVYKMQVAYDLDLRKAEAQAGWAMTPGAHAALDDFALFRARYFRTPAGDPYITKKFHRGWIKALDHAVATGGRQMILSPPRHGKTDLLIHYTIWLIVRNPAIRIIWVGGSEDLAQQAVGAVMDALESNLELRADFLPPGDLWQPPRGSGMWSQSKFKVANRPAGIKAPTMTALGRGSKLPSRDADFIICDDIEDVDSVVQPTGRANTRNWFMVSLQTRKMRHTAIAYITSRVHPDDLSGHLLDNNLWGPGAIVEQMHNPACQKPADATSRHISCMLFPEVNPYGYYLEQKESFQLEGGVERFDMVYQNVDRPLGMRHFDKGVLHASRNMSRAVGEIPPGMRLIAGLDPATVGGQAAFLWGYQTTPTVTQAMVDLDLEAGGGLVGIRRIVRQWYEAYGLAEWVMEDVDTTRIARNDHELMDYCSRHGIHIHSHTTGVNKWDAAYGVTSYVPMFEAGMIDLPYAGDEARRKTDMYIGQLLRFTGDARQAGKQNQSDLVMASWFPKDRIRLTRYSEIRRARRIEPDMIPTAGADIAWPF